MTSSVRSAEPTRLVLIVDPEANHVRTLEKILRRSGFRVARARSATEALRILAEQRVHAILCEVILPDSSAEALLESALTLSPRTLVVFTCGEFEERRRQRLIERGAHECTSLPIDLDRLKALLGDG